MLRPPRASMDQVVEPPRRRDAAPVTWMARGAGSVRVTPPLQAWALPCSQSGTGSRVQPVPLRPRDCVLGLAHGVIRVAEPVAVGDGLRLPDRPALGTGPPIVSRRPVVAWRVAVVHLHWDMLEQCPVPLARSNALRLGTSRDADPHESAQPARRDVAPSWIATLGRLNRPPPHADNPDMVTTDADRASLIGRAALALLLAAGFYALAIAILAGLGFIIYLEATSESLSIGITIIAGLGIVGIVGGDRPEASEVQRARTSRDLR